MTETLENLSQLIQTSGWLAPLLALLAGILTSFTPCSLSSIPLVIGYIGHKTSISVVAHLCSRSSCDIYYTRRDCFHCGAARGNIRVVVVHRPWSTNGIDGLADMGYI